MKFDSLLLTFETDNDCEQFAKELDKGSKKYNASILNTGQCQLNISVPKENMIHFMRFKNLVYRKTVGKTLRTVRSAYEINRSKSTAYYNVVTGEMI